MAKSSPTVSASNRVARSETLNDDRNPIHAIRHRRLKASIWRNETDKGPFFNVTIVRSYREKDGQWKDSHSLGYDDLMNVAALMQEAHAFISSLRATESARQSTTRR